MTTTPATPISNGQLPAGVLRLKESIRDQCGIDVSEWYFETATGRKVYPFPDAGAMVWIDPYVESTSEMEMVAARDALGDDPDNQEAYFLMTDRLAERVLGYNLTDKYGEPLPQPDSGKAVRDHLPSAFVLMLINEALVVKVETEGEGPSASGATGSGS